LPAPADKIQAAAPQKATEEKPRSVADLKAVEGKAEPEAALKVPEDQTQTGQKMDQDKNLPVAVPKQEA
jgi:hypothetical protein